MNLAKRLEDIRQSYKRKGLELKPPATEEVVQAFEERYKIRLPEAYRRFVTEVSNGCAGPPYYGIFPVGEADHDEMGRIYEGYAPYLEFPLCEAWVWEGDEDYDEARIDVIHARGHIYLGTDGCGIQHVLITSGPEQGNVWIIAGEGAQPIHFDENRRYDFLDWLEAWLEGKEQFSG